MVVEEKHSALLLVVRMSIFDLGILVQKPSILDRHHHEFMAAYLLLRLPWSRCRIITG